MRAIMSVAAILMLVGCSAPIVGRDTAPTTVTVNINAPVNAPVTINVNSPAVAVVAPSARTDSFYKQSLMPLALTIWAESRGEGDRGMRLVGNVILNRVKKGSWGSSVDSVVMAPAQFSPWAKGSATRRRLESIRAAVLNNGPGVPDDFRIALAIADDLLTGEINKNRRDISLGAVYFHATYIRPAWSKADRVTVRHGGHVFLR